MAKETQETKPLRINRIVPNDMRSVFANHFVIRHLSGGFYLYFFEMEPPLILGDEPDEMELDRIDAYCVAKIAVTQETMGSMIAAMAENFAKKQQKEASSNKANDTTEKDRPSASSPKKNAVKGGKHAG